MADRNRSSLLRRNPVGILQLVTWRVDYTVEKQVWADLWVVVDRRTFDPSYSEVKFQVERELYASK
jgi:hypothetical protein